jgi:hypothetical protein
MLAQLVREAAASCFKPWAACVSTMGLGRGTLSAVAAFLVPRLIGRFTGRPT